MNEREKKLEAACNLYLKTYSETQTHPTPSQEVAVIIAMRDALKSASNHDEVQRAAAEE